MWPAAYCDMAVAMHTGDGASPATPSHPGQVDLPPIAHHGDWIDVASHRHVRKLYRATHPILISGVNRVLPAVYAIGAVYDIT